MSLSERLQDYVRACFTGLWLESHEPQEAMAELQQLCRAQEWTLANWNLAVGWQVAGNSSEQLRELGTDPLTAIRSTTQLAAGAETALIVLQNFHRFLQSAEVVQAISQLQLAGRQLRIIVVILAPVVQLPIELEKLFVVLEHELPTRAELALIAQELVGSSEELPDSSERERVLDAAVGLTRLEAENAFSLALVRESRLTAQTVWELKAQTLKKSGLLTLYQGQEDFSSLGGLAALKSFCKRALLQPSAAIRCVSREGFCCYRPPAAANRNFARLWDERWGGRC